MLIYPRPSKDCGQCREEKNCECECHNKDLINCKHHEIHYEDFDLKVKPVVDLDHFRP